MVSLIILGGSYQMMMFRKKKLRTEWLKKRNARKSNPPASKMESIRVSDHLSAEKILFFEKGTGHESILEELVGVLSCENSAALTAAIQEREKMGSTAITSEIAFPHARIPGLNQIAGAIGLCPSGVQTSAGAAIRLFFLFISPIENTGNHLRFLASAASLFLAGDMLEDLMRLKTPEAVFEKIQACESENKRKNSEALR